LADQKPVASMTGFARQEGSHEAVGWTWEVKSVNGKSLDLRCRLPNGYEDLDARARAAAARRFARGNLQVNLTVDTSEQPARLKVNDELLEQLVEVSKSLKQKTGADAPRLDGLLALRGVVEMLEAEESEETGEARRKAMLSDLERVMDALAETRGVEGARLGALAENHLGVIQGLVEAASASAHSQPEALRERLKKQLEELLEAAPALPEERLAQEAAVLITKADVREELDRLEAHVESARELLAEGGPVGRRLDFLCQEFNREANTLCAKSPDIELTRIGLELKNVVDQLREQVQNIE
jgi:uncharacterized protein (TIGR00255 family)